MSFVKRPRPGVYEDVPLEMFANRLPAWPLGDSMSYTRDRSAPTRGVGAVAANDLREGRGGAVVRTARGVVTIVRKPGIGRKNRWGELSGTPAKQQDGGSRGSSGSRGTKPKTAPTDVWGHVRTNAIVRPGAGRAVNPSQRVPVRRIVTTSGTVVLTGGGPIGPIPGVPVSAGGQAVPYSPPKQQASSASSGGGGGGGGGGGAPDGPDDGAAPDDQAAPDDAAPTDATAALPPKPMHPAVKAAVVAGAGWALLKMMAVI